MQIHTLKGYIQSIYLVEYDHGLLLLDGCCRGDVETVCDFIQSELARPLSDLKRIVVTHMHPDHAGGAHALRKRTGCRIATGVSDRPWYQGFEGMVMHATDILLGHYMAKRLGKPYRTLWYPRLLKADEILREGDLVPEFEEWQILETHGHTNGDISLWHKPSHRIYVADLIVKVRQNFITPWPIFHPNRYRTSVEKIRALAPDYLLLAHGGEIVTEPNHPCFDVHTPRLPRTHWRALKYRVKRLIART